MRNTLFAIMGGFFWLFISDEGTASSQSEAPGGDIASGENGFVPPSEQTADLPSINVRSEVRRQKITQWGHDIKQVGKALNLTSEASREIFEEGSFNLLRIPIYANAHDADGSLKSDYFVSLRRSSDTDRSMKWELVPADEGWFHLRNVKFDKYVRAFPPGRGLETPNTLEIDATRHDGPWTQWRWVDAGAGWFHLESQGHGKYLRSNNQGDLGLVETDRRGNWTQWKFIEAGESRYRIRRRGLEDKYLQGGGSEYDRAMEAILNAVDNGNPDLFASHKIYDSSDQSTTRNVNFGSFYTSDGVDPAGFAALIDTFVEFVETETGQPVKYLAPRCELGNHWTPEAFVDVVNELENRRLIVAPEAAWAVNAERFLTPDVKALTDIKSTHNKMQSPLWPDNAHYDWDGETVGGEGDKFITLFFKLHEAIYKGRVTGIVFWGDTHLSSTDDDNNNGPFRRELVEASEQNVVKVEISSNPQVSAIAFETDEENSVRVFYCATEDVRFRFDRPLSKDSVPAEAFRLSSQTFKMPATGVAGYGSFTVSFVD